MKKLSHALRLAAAALAFSASFAQAGGPLGVCNFAPLKYPGAGTVTLNYDQGTLGTRSKAQADAIVSSAVAVWTNVPTASVTIARGGDLGINVDGTNYLTLLNSGTDGINPVIYDSDGLIVDSLIGAGAKSFVLGFAGSFASGSPCRYTEGRAVISGYLAISDATLTTTIAHEVGHLIGMDHTQLDSTQGLGTPNYPLMYPIAYRTLAGLHDDDIAAVSALYPDATFNSVYGQVSGNFMQSGTPVKGANLWAREITTNKVYSIVSDYLLQNTGYFKLALPAGTYDLHAEAIDSQFDGGSSVGPYSDAYPTDPSFQPPLYPSLGVPMAPLTLGNGAPIQFNIIPGCAATAVFNFNGTGSVTGNCVAAADITSPVNHATLTATSQLFQWTSVAGATNYQLYVGSTLGALDIGAFPSGGTTGLSTTVTGLPTDGRTIYVRLYTFVGGNVYSKDFSYTAVTVAPPPVAQITSPVNGSVLAGSSQLFQWTNVGATNYQVFVGNAVGGSDIGYFPAAGTPGTSTTVTGLPTDGRTLYVRLYSLIAGTWYTRDFTYIAATVAVVPAVITSPANGGTLGGASQLLQWTSAPGATLYQVFVGNTVGGLELGYFPTLGTTGTSTTITGLPTDGRTIYVRLYSRIGGVYYTRDFTYTAANVTPTPAAITSPANGGTLAGASQLFQWNDAGATLYQVFVGNSVGAFDIGYFPAMGTTGLSTTVTGLPTDGRTIYVRLYSRLGGVYYTRDFTYVAANVGPPPPASMTSPANGSTLGGSSQLFQWNNAGASLYQVFVGNSVGAYDIGYFPTLGTTGTSTTITGLPTDGRTLYVRLYSNIGGVYYSRDYTYTAASSGPPAPAMVTNPSNGTLLHGSSQLFQWNAAPGASLYQVFVGNSLGAYDIGYFPAAGTTGTSTTITGLPTDGRVIYVRLYTGIAGVYYTSDFTYVSGP